MENFSDTARFCDWPDSFQPHLRSIVALRMWEEEDAFQKAQRALKGEMMRAAKARGPNAPRFSARRNGLSGMDPVDSVLDLRGGHRPVHNQIFDLAWAPLTAFSMSDEFMETGWERLYNGIDKNIGRFDGRWQD